MAWDWIWKILPKNANFLNFFPSGQKKSFLVGSKCTQVKGGLASYLLLVKRYALAGSGQGPSLRFTLIDFYPYKSATWTLPNHSLLEKPS